jgi:hypothetical protein
MLVALAGFYDYIFGETHISDIENNIIVLRDDSEENVNVMFVGEDFVGKIFGNWYTLEVKAIPHLNRSTTSISIPYQKTTIKKLLKDDTFEKVIVTLKNSNFFIKNKNAARVITLKQ